MSKFRTILFTLLTAFLLVTFFRPAACLAADQERVDVLIYLIEKNLYREPDGDDTNARLKSWDYNADNAIKDMNELLKKVSEFRYNNEQADLPDKSAAGILFEEKDKNFQVLHQYRTMLEYFKKGITNGNFTKRSDFNDEWEKKSSEIDDFIADNEPLEVLKKYDVAARLDDLGNRFQDARKKDTLDLLEKELSNSWSYYALYRREVSDLRMLREQYQKILQFNEGNGSAPNPLGESGKGKSRDKKTTPINFDTNWGKSNMSWREFNVGETIYPRIENINGGSGSYQCAWILDGILSGFGREFNYRFTKPGMHYLVAKVTDSKGQSRWQSYAYNVRGRGGQWDTLDFSYDISKTNPRAGETVYFDIQDIWGGTSPYYYKWEINGREFSTGKYSHYQFPSAGRYELKVRVKDNYGNRKEKTHTFQIAGTTRITFKLWSSNSYPRLNDTVQYEFQDINGGESPYRYKWSTNTGASGTGQRFSCNFRKRGVHKLTVTVYDRRNRSSSQTFTYNVGGSSGSSINASIGYSTDQPRMGQSVNLFVKSLSGGNSPYTYEWYEEGRLFSRDRNPRYAWNQSGKYKVTLKVTDSDGNSSSVHQYFNVGSGGGSLSFSDWLSSSSPSYGQSVNMRVTNLQGGTAPYQYRWEMDGRVFSSSNSASYRFNDSGTHTLKITVTDRYGQSQTRTRTFNVQGLSPLSFNLRVSNSSPKSGDTATFNVQNIQGGQSPYNVSWTMNGQTIGSGTGASYRFNNSGSYSLTVTVRDSANSVKTRTQNFQVSQKPTPTPTTPLHFNIRASNTSPKQGQNVSFSISGLRGGTPPYNVSWTLNGAGIGSGNNLSYTFRKTGSYTVQAQVRDASGQTRTSSVVVQVKGFQINPAR